MNFILKFLDRATSYANKYAVQKEIDSLRGTIMHFQTLLGEVEDGLSVRIFSLEQKLASQPKISLWPKQEPSALWQNTLMSTTDAVIHCLKSSNGEKLYYKNIYDIIQSYNLINKNVSIQSVKATLYQLARQKRIVLDNGSESGMFFIEKE